MRALGVVMVAPSADLFAGMTQGFEPVQVQAFVPELAVEALNEGVLDWLSGLDEPQPHAGPFGPSNIALLVPSGPLSRMISSGSPNRRARSSRKRATAPRLSQ